MTSFKAMTDTKDNLCINTIRTLPWMPCSRPTRAIPARLWHWRRSPTACGSVCCAMIQPILSGPTATALFSPGHASMLLYAMLHLTGVKAVNAKYETLGQPP